MINLKGKIALGLCAIMILGGSATAFAENEEAVLISAPIKAEEEFEFISFEGIVKEVSEDGENLRVLLTKEDNDESLILSIGETVLIVGEEEQKILSKEDIKLDLKVSAEYHKNTPMGLSYPGILTPDVLVIKSSNMENPGTVFVENFDKDLLSADNELKLLVSDETSIMDVDGNMVSKENIYNRDLVVFYSIIMPSLPAQTNPTKIIVLPAREEMEQINEIVLSNELFQLEDGTKMIPLREVAEALGFEVTWNNETKSVELVKGINWSTLTIGRNNYNFARMLIRLESAPIIVEARTYVPASFAEQVLQAQVIYQEDGSIKIK
ncbi:MAG: copper amine oxidase N-terminal domain-containing protein [Gudongella sp.]|nr:copper amine oxidase N-terminal domain-containing protein [Gudongella sp.]